LQLSIINPFLDFTRHKSWWLILLFVVIYKFADAFIGIVTNPFLLAIGFTKNDISYIVKIYGTIATLLGTFAGGALVMRYGAVRIMFVAGFLHALTNLLYGLQAHIGADSTLLTVSIIVENVSGGVSSAAFVAFLSNLCNRHYTATQYALLSSLAAFGRTWLSAPAGFAVKYLGWEAFFYLATLLALPGLLVLWWLQKRLQ
jgi:PAT family beta-lactamase induction signal transducer AmpG